MKIANVWDILNDKVTYKNNIEEIVNYIKKNYITDFSVIDENGMQDGKVVTNFVEIFNKEGKKANKIIKYVDYLHPFLIDTGGNVYFEKTFFEENKKIIQECIIDNYRNTEYLFVSKNSYSDELAKSILDTVKSITFEEGILLSDEVIKLYKDKRIDSYIYVNGEKKQISSSKILGLNYNEVISDKKEIIIYDNITDLDNLKYIPENKTIIICKHNLRNNDDTSLENYDNYYNIISKLRNNNQNNKIIVKVNNRKAFSKSKLYNSNYDIIIDGIDLTEYKLEELKKEDELLDLMVSDINNSNFSPFEKFIAVYNITKKFKEYLESEENTKDSRVLNKFLNNDYMVCAGYARLLITLLERININSMYYSVIVDDSYDKGFTLEEKPVTINRHARVIFSICDPKYNIDGFYVSDPTWDNCLENDYYNHTIISFDKTSLAHNYLYLNELDLILNCKNINEYSNNINMLIDRKKDIVYGDYKLDKQKENNAIKNVINIINRILKSLYPDKYVELNKKYDKLNKFIPDKTSQYNFINEAGLFFIDKLGRDIPIETVIEAASNVNKEVFGLDDVDLEKYKSKLLEENKNSDKKVYPYYYTNDEYFSK